MALKCPPNTPVGKTPICDDLGLESIIFYTQPQKQTRPALTHSESSRSMIPHKLRKGPAWLRAPWRAAECLGTTSLMPVQAPPHKVGSSGSSPVLSSAGTSPQALACRMHCLITCMLLHYYFSSMLQSAYYSAFFFRIRCVGRYIIYEFHFLDSKEVSQMF